MKDPMLYCPYCDLEMHGNIHKNESKAWGMHECEYRSNDKLFPLPVVTELERNKLAITRMTKEKNDINSAVRKLKARNIELDLI